jgi:DNA-directed RNA polymerase alpha subunit
MPQLHETGYGRRLFEHELPELNKSLSRIAIALEKISNQDSKDMVQIFQDWLNKNKEPNEVVTDNISLLRSIKLKTIFSVRIANALLFCKYPKHNLFDLCISKESELKSTKNFGAKCLWEVNEYLSKRGLEFEMNETDIKEKVLHISQF